MVALAFLAPWLLRVVRVGRWLHAVRLRSLSGPPTLSSGPAINCGYGNGNIHCLGKRESRSTREANSSSITGQEHNSGLRVFNGDLGVRSALNIDGGNWSAHGGPRHGWYTIGSSDIDRVEDGRTDWVVRKKV